MDEVSVSVKFFRTNIIMFTGFSITAARRKKRGKALVFDRNYELQIPRV